jgi:3,4-dihydroxy 2-butanone 4-phosphate synthase/GTP cyclohydrolase II
MVPCDENEDAMSTAFTVSCDLVKSTTGISADERAATIARLGDLSARSDEFARPGHVFPLRSREGGVLKRAGHTEAAYDLSVLAGCSPAGVLCEIVNDSDGNMARLPQLREFSKKYGLKMVLISDLVRYRRNRQALVERSASARIPTNHGKFTAVSYRSKKDDIEHVAFVYGDDLDAVSGDNVLVRVHSECLTGDIFHSTRCDCGDQLDMAMKKVAAEGRGVIVYLRGQEGRGIGLGHKLRAYNLQDKGRDTVQANEDLGLPVDSREYGVGAQILQDLGVRTVRLMTNNPAKYNGLKGFGLTIVNRVPLCAPITLDNMRYIETKRAKMGHTFLDESDGLKSVPTEEDGIEDIPAMDASEEVVPC